MWVHGAVQFSEIFKHVKRCSSSYCALSSLCSPTTYQTYSFEWSFGFSNARVVFLFLLAGKPKVNVENFYVPGSILIGVYFIFEKFTFGRNLQVGWSTTMVLWVIKLVIHLVPSFNYSLIFMKFLSIWQNNSRCSQSPASLRSDCESKFNFDIFICYDRYWTSNTHRVCFWTYFFRKKK